MPVSYPVKLTAVGTARYTDAMSASVALSSTPDSGVALPDTADYAVIILGAQAAYVNFDATAADSNDVLWPVSTPLEVNGQRKLLEDFRAIEATASAALYVQYFTSR